MICLETAGMTQCPICIMTGNTGYLKSYYVNLEESVILCTNEQCCYLQTDDVDLDTFTNFDLDFTSILGTELTNNHIQCPNTNNPHESSKSLKPVASVQKICERKADDANSVGLKAYSDTAPKYCPKKSDSSDIEFRSLYSTDLKFWLLWRDKECSSYLDVLLTHLCYNNKLKWVLQNSFQNDNATHLLAKVRTTFYECQEIVGNLQDTEDGIFAALLETKFISKHAVDGSLASSQAKAADLTKQPYSTTRRKLDLATMKMDCVREEVLLSIDQNLELETKCKKSPAETFQKLIDSAAEFTNHIQCEYTTSYKCSFCGHSANTRTSSSMLTIAETVQQLIPSQCLQYKSSCTMCEAADQYWTTRFVKFNECLVIHLAKGIPALDLSSLDFKSTGERFEVTALIEHKPSSSADQFILWQRDPEAVAPSTKGRWLLYDSSCLEFGQFHKESPDVKPDNVRFVIWEKVNSCNVNNQTKSAQLTVQQMLPVKIKTASQKDPKLSSTVPPYVVLEDNSVMSQQPSVNAEVTKEPSVTLNKSAEHSKHSNDNWNQKKSKVTGSNTKTTGSSSANAVMPLPVAKNMFEHRSTSEVQVIPHSKPSTSFSSQIAPTIRKPVLSNSLSKSYLDLAKSLVKKNKAKKEGGLSGYVPLTKRDNSCTDENNDKDCEILSKKKKVMFTAETNSNVQNSASNVIQVLDRRKRRRQGTSQTTPSNSTSTSKNSQKQRVSFISSEPAPENTNNTYDLTDGYLEGTDMPSLEDMYSL